MPRADHCVTDQSRVRHRHEILHELLQLMGHICCRFILSVDEFTPLSLIIASNYEEALLHRFQSSKKYHDTTSH